MLSALRATQQALEATQTSTFGAQVHLYHIYGGSCDVAQTAAWRVQADSEDTGAQAALKHATLAQPAWSLTSACTTRLAAPFWHRCHLSDTILAEHGLCRLGSGLGGCWDLPNAWPCCEKQRGRAGEAIQVRPQDQIDGAVEPVVTNSLNWRQNLQVNCTKISGVEYTYRASYGRVHELSCASLSAAC